MDINLAVGRNVAIADDKLSALPQYGTDPRYTPRERAALAYAEMVTISPNDIDDELFAEVRRHFSEREVVEITAQAALENYRARINRALRIEDDGFAHMNAEELPSVLKPRPRA
jgi:alkylhydroperoxidase family enzyme